MIHAREKTKLVSLKSIGPFIMHPCDVYRAISAGHMTCDQSDSLKSVL